MTYIGDSFVVSFRVVYFSKVKEMDKNPKKGLKKFFEHLIYKSSKSLMKHLTRYKMLGKGCVFSVVETVREAALSRCS